MKKYIINVNGNSYEVEVEEVKDGTVAPRVATPVAPAAPVAASPAPAAPAKPAAPKPAPSAGGASVTSPMPGNIFKVLVKAGDAVKKGDVLIILEAMKMENEIFAPADGVVSSVTVAEGASVNAGDVLVNL